MAFKEAPRFPDRIAFGAVGGPAYNTSIVTVSSGVEARNQNWSESRQEYDVSSGVKTEADFKAIDAFFRAVRGKAIGFRFKDWLDFRVGIDEGVVAGLTTTTFQLQKQYESGSDESPRVIKKPIASGFVLKDSGVTLMVVTDYTLDATTGIVTTTAPHTAADLAWSGEFDVPVRFDVDKLQGQVLSKNPSDGFLVSWDSIPLVELKNP
jgi:uncharacterized protein (TIGR02217 family)